MKSSFRRILRTAVPLVVVSTLVLNGLTSPFPAQESAYAAAPVVMLYGSAPDSPDNQLQALVEDTVKGLPGNWGVVVKKLDTGQYAAYNGDVQQVSASLYKMWVLAELFHQAKEGILTLDGYATVSGEDAAYDASLNELRMNVGSDVTLRRAATLMITLSDNTAAALLVRMLGPDNINRFMRQNGLDHSILDWNGGGDNLTTPLDVLREMEMLSTSQMVDAEASKQMIDLMLGQQINNLLPPGLPDGTPFAHKTGALGYLLHDAGIVYSPSGPYIIVCMASNLDDYGTAWNAMPELSRKVYSYFTSRPSNPALYFPQTRQSVGHDFLKFWHSYGGVEKFGYPISPEQMEGSVLVQQFERARFEWHAENAGSPGPQPEVVLGLVGYERAYQLGLSWPSSPDPGTGKYFPQTGQAITGAFYDYWLNNGGERMFGLPMSPATDMVSPSDGKTYNTQWFQRARLEIHPELPAGKRIVLGTLGTELASFGR